MHAIHRPAPRRRRHPQSPRRSGRHALLGATWAAGIAAALFLIVADADQPAVPSQAIAPAHVALTIGR